jgi:hypothetical protein
VSRGNASSQYTSHEGKKLIEASHNAPLDPNQCIANCTATIAAIAAIAAKVQRESRAPGVRLRTDMALF